MSGTVRNVVCWLAMHEGYDASTQLFLQLCFRSKDSIHEIQIEDQEPTSPSLESPIIPWQSLPLPLLPLMRYLYVKGVFDHDSGQVPRGHDSRSISSFPANISLAIYNGASTMEQLMVPADQPNNSNPHKPHSGPLPSDKPSREFTAPPWVLLQSEDTKMWLAF